MSTDNVDLERAVEALCEVLRPQAELIASTEGRTLSSCLVSLIRPLVKSYLDPDAPCATLRLVDNRTKPWKASMQFWDISEGDERGELLAETDPEIYTGLGGITEAIWEYVNQVHEEDGVTHNDISAMRDTLMAKRMAGIRPAISRGDGKATLKIYYATDPSRKYLCAVDIARVEKSA